MSEKNYAILWRVTLADRHFPTGNTVHYRGDEVLPLPHGLRITRYPDDDGYYLIYVDENFNELTDTYHDDIDSAMEQAEWEFGVKATEWERVGHS